MVNYDEIIEKAKNVGFTTAAPLSVDTLIFMPEVRDMCASGKCQKYGKSWACPPACGTLEEMRGIVKSYEKGLILQTVGQLEDEFDWEELRAAAIKQSESFRALWKELKGEFPRLYPMGSGGCSKCEECTYPDAPCRHPDELSSSMEACGLLVSRVCTDNNVPYNYGPKTIAYTGCFLLE